MNILHCLYQSNFEKKTEQLCYRRIFFFQSNLEGEDMTRAQHERPAPN